MKLRAIKSLSSEGGGGGGEPVGGGLGCNNTDTCGALALPVFGQHRHHHHHRVATAGVGLPLSVVATAAISTARRCYRVTHPRVESPAASPPPSSPLACSEGLSRTPPCCHLVCRIRAPVAFDSCWYRSIKFLKLIERAKLLGFEPLRFDPWDPSRNFSFFRDLILVRITRVCKQNRTGHCALCARLQLPCRLAFFARALL